MIEYVVSIALGLTAGAFLGRRHLARIVGAWRRDR